MRYFSTRELVSKKEEITGELKKKLWVHADPRFSLLVKKYLKAADKIADLGCGSGYLAKRLIEEFHLPNVELIDLADYRSEEQSKPLPFYQADFNFDRLPFADGAKDALFAIEVWEHLENGFNFVREIERVLKPSGLLFLSVPNGYSLFSRLKFLFKRELESYDAATNHINFLPKDIFFQVLFKNFQLVERFYNQRYLKLSRLGLAKFINFKYPRTELFGTRVLYLFKKYENRHFDRQ
ncbi:MAG: hypothetical protein A2927_00355 [Candidatus Komeilibacteria bacterium RIFCSPLOWO2_01_FULL_45_10]|uniref:Methyltransferase type 11 domain-containing protein n=1 Tax=Candidatus Komeilibacteria bacterium RIFCSPLOWO2_01_FULL_45_10 TaxID=1798550 RepID=A0A1G2BIB8_9BACT|nr:MAG: hypothetical protein A2927_00355 [Candidatus Komeilibacteria bacterium RIFCSPLOWO2_01_FULL_45_10]